VCCAPGLPGSSYLCSVLQPTDRGVLHTREPKFQNFSRLLTKLPEHIHLDALNDNTHYWSHPALSALMPPAAQPPTTRPRCCPDEVLTIVSPGPWRCVWVQRAVLGCWGGAVTGVWMVQMVLRPCCAARTHMLCVDHRAPAVSFFVKHQGCPECFDMITAAKADPPNLCQTEPALTNLYGPPNAVALSHRPLSV
jgi:hypothetical protein